MDDLSLRLSQCMPPMMGLDDEMIFYPRQRLSAHYTALHNNHRVFVFWAGDGWLVMVTSNVMAGDITSIEAHISHGEFVAEDGLVLRAAIEHLTSGGNDAV